MASVPSQSESVLARQAAGGRIRWASTAFGLLLVFVFWRLDEVFHYGARFGPVLAFVSREELAFWVTHLLLGLSGAAFLGHGLSGRMAMAARRGLTAFEALDANGWRVAAVMYGVVLFAFAHIGRKVVLLDLPVTDDENGILFGARMLLHGDVRVPLLTPAGAYNDLFTYVRDGLICSIDYPGGLLFRAGSLATGGSLLYALASAVAGVAVAAAALRLTDARGALVAAMVWLASPMVFALSLTTHAHVASRAFLAIAIYFAARVLAPKGGERPDRAAALFGLAAGFGFLVRSIEIGACLAPLGVLLVTRAARGVPGYRRYVAVALAGMAPSLAFYGWYNLQTTGHLLVQARFGTGANNSGSEVRQLGLWSRIPVNFCFESLMLSVWFLGPLGVLFAWLGVTRDRAVSVALAAGVGLALAVTLAHSYTGVHVVGPIHFSEAPVLLTLLAVFGVQRSFEGLLRIGWPRAPMAVALAVTVLGGYALFDAVHARSLGAQAEVQGYPLEVLARHDVHHAVVIADTLALLYADDPVGSWVLQFPHPDPYLRGDLIFARATADVAALRRKFPDRAFWRLTITGAPPSLSVVPLDPGVIQ